MNDHVSLKGGVKCLLSAFLLVLGVNASWASVTLPYDYGFEDYNLATDGWTTKNPSDRNSSEFAIVGAAKKTGSYGFRFSSYSANGVNTQYLISPEMPTTAAISLAFEYAASSSSGNETFKVGYSTTDAEIESFIWGDEISTNSTSWKTYEGSFPVGTKYIAVYYYSNYQYRLYVDDFSFSAIVDGPALTLLDGEKKMKSGDAFDFGLTSAETTKTLTVSNTGTADLSGLTVESDGNISASVSADNIAKGSSVTLSLTMPSTYGPTSCEITLKGNGIDNFVIKVSGTVRDPNKVFVDFADAALPEGWTAETSSTYYSWTYGEGYAGYGGSSSSYTGTLTSPKLTFEAGEKLLFTTAKYGTWYTPSVSVQTSADGTNWTTLATYTDDIYGTWTNREVTIPSADVKYIRFSGWYFYITNIYGGELPNEPNMKVTAANYHFGAVSESASTTFVIENKGKATLSDISVTASSADVTIADAPTSLEAGASATVTVTLDASAVGAKEATITVSAPDQETATFKVDGYVLDTEVILVDFAGNAVPDGWVNSGFEVSNNELTAGYSTRTLTSPAITVSEGQKLMVYAKGGSTYGARLTVKTSTDNGTTWTTAKEFTTELRQNTTDYVVLLVDNIAAGNYKLQFEGYYVTINTINGYEYNQNAPELAVSPTEDAAFGVVTAAASKTYTVTNKGTGTLTVNIASDNELFTVSPATLDVTTEPQTFDVTFTPKEETYGKFEANITVTPTYDETAAVTIAASAQVKNPNVWDEDFEAGTMPTGWEANNWTIGTFSSYENKTPMALAPSSSTAGTLITPQLEAKAGDVLTWDAYLNWYDETLKVEYSNDDKATWTEIYNYKTQSDSEAPSTTTRNYHKAMSFTAPADGNYYLRFTSTYQNGVDNFNGFKLVVKDHDATITASNIPATGDQLVEYTATVTVKELAGKDEAATAKLYVDGKEVAAQDATLTANGETTITITYTPQEAVDAKATYIEVTYEDITLKTDESTVTINPYTLLDEEATEFTLAKDTYNVLKLGYTVKKGYGTICLPFTVNDLSVFGEGVKVYKFDGFNDDESMKFTSQTRLDWGTPYIIYVENPTTDDILFRNQSLSATEADATEKNDVTFQGSFTKTTFSAEDVAANDFYGIQNATAKVLKAKEGTTMKGFRAYFKTAKGDAANFSISFDDGTNSISVTTADMLSASGEVYDLSGRKVDASALKAGVYVRNGKKFVVK